MNLQLLLVQMVNGLTTAMIYFLLAVGFTLVFGLMNFVNFAHGAFLLLGCYLMYEFVQQRMWNFWLSVLLTVVIVALLGALIEFVLLRRMYAMEHTYQIVATFALALIIQEGVTWIWGPDPFTVPEPGGLGDPIVIGTAGFSKYRLVVVAIALLIAAALWFVIERTRYGAKLRAGSENAPMTAALGINVPRLFAATFALSAGLAALAGALWTPMQSVTPNTGNLVLGLAVIVVVVGGIGSYTGAFLAAILIAEVQAIAITYKPALQDVITFAIMAVVLLWKSEAVVRRLRRG